MLNAIWAGMILAAVVFAAMNGRMPELSAAVTNGAGTAVTTMLSITGMLCLWTGLMKVAEKAGLMAGLAKLLSPVIRLLFPGLKKGEAREAIAMNMGANLLGLSNAATPLGLRAMKELSKLSGDGETASRHMITFVVMNCASIQLIPTTVAALRAAAGSAEPFSITPAVWIASFLALVGGIIVSRLLGLFAGRERR